MIDLINKENVLEFAQNKESYVGGYTIW
jgi:hypothetical protein